MIKNIWFTLTRLLRVKVKSDLNKIRINQYISKLFYYSRVTERGFLIHIPSSVESVWGLGKTQLKNSLRTHGSC
jgi:hypothetical protein